MIDKNVDIINRDIEKLQKAYDNAHKAKTAGGALGRRSRIAKKLRELFDQRTELLQQV